MKQRLDLPEENSTNYPLSVQNQLLKIEYSEDEKSVLKYHQFVVKEFFTRTDTRGLLICHGMGQGKTRLAVAIAEYIRKFDKDRDVIILSAKSLESNFRKEIAGYSGKTESEIDENYKFISLNSSNMFKHVSNADKTDEQNAFEKKLGNFMDDVVRSSSLNDSFLIVDEAHNLFNAITNGAKNAVKLYDLLMETKNIKILFMSGTPIINDPFELVPCFNILRGPMETIGGSEYDFDAESHEGGAKMPKRERKYTTLFPEEIEDFDAFFVDRDHRTIKNKEKFTNRIYGLCSYYSDLYFSNETNKPGFPTELPTIVERIAMSDVQFGVYTEARLSELAETKRSYKAKNSRFSSVTGASSTYRVKSRQISNFCIPEYALGPVRAYKSREKFIHKIEQKDYRNLEKYSPKMAKIISNIKKSPGVGIVYSQFVSGEGINIFAEVLKSLGWNKYGEEQENLLELANVQIPKGLASTGVFDILSGEIDPEQRAKTIQKFNSGEGNIKLLLLSGAVAEGIDLKKVRHVHIMEPFWNMARINQVKTRAIRYLSHEELPEEDRNVQVYIYLSDYPSDYPKDKITEQTTDVDLYEKSVENMQIIDTFMLTLAEASIDCGVHHKNLDSKIQEKIKCKMCSPNNNLLYHPLLRKDMDLPSNCNPMNETKINANEITLPDSPEKYYWNGKGNDIKIYHFSKKLNGYTPLVQSDSRYGRIMQKILLL